MLKHDCSNYVANVYRQLRLDFFRTRNSVIADKPHNTFRGQSRSPNMVPYVRYGFLLVCYSNFVPNTQFFRYSTSKNVVTLKSGQRSLKVIESDTIR